MLFSVGSDSHLRHGSHVSVHRQLLGNGNVPTNVNMHSLPGHHECHLGQSPHHVSVFLGVRSLQTSPLDTDHDGHHHAVVLGLDAQLAILAWLDSVSMTVYEIVRSTVTKQGDSRACSSAELRPDCCPGLWRRRPRPQELSRHPELRRLCQLL